MNQGKYGEAPNKRLTESESATPGGTATPRKTLQPLSNNMSKDSNSITEPPKPNSGNTSADKTTQEPVAPQAHNMKPAASPKQPSTETADINLLDDRTQAPATFPADQPTSGEPPIQNFVSGSQLGPQSTGLPVGVYIIAGYNLLAVISAVFGGANGNFLIIILLLVNLLLAAGLLTRMELARRLMVWFAVATIFLQAINIFLLINFQQNIAQNKTEFESAVSRVDENNLTREEREQLAALQETVREQEGYTDEVFVYVYAIVAINIVGNSVIAYYLSRPKVKAVFK